MVGPGAVRFHVYYRQVGKSGWLVLPGLGAASTTGFSASFTGRGGESYIFKVAGEDAKGHIGEAAYAKTIVPVDDSATRKKRYFGNWGLSRSKRFYYNSEHRSKQAGDIFTYDFVGRQVFLIGSRGPDHGQLEITLDGRPFETIDLYAPKPEVRRVLWQSGALKPIVSITPHQLKARVVGTTGRPLVGIDAVARVR